MKKSFYWIFDPRFSMLLKSFLKYKSDLSPVIVNSYEDKYSREKQVILNNSKCKEDEIVIDDEEITNLLLSKEIKDRKLEALPTISFTNQDLQIPDKYVLGANHNISNKLNSKIFQRQKLNVSNIPTFFYNDIFDFLKERKKLLAQYKRLVLTPEFTAGGNNINLIDEESEVNTESYKGKIIVSPFLSHISSPACGGIISRDGNVQILEVYEQLLNKFRFDGVIYPAYLSSNIQDRIKEVTLKAAEELKKYNYYGFFNVDFLLTPSEEIFVSELNVRFTFSSIMYNMFIDNIFEFIETGIIRKNDLPDFKDRIIISKKRIPYPGFILKDYKNVSKIDNLLTNSDEFEEHYFDKDIKMITTHYIGIFGKRFSINTSKTEVIKYYEENRFVD